MSLLTHSTSKSGAVDRRFEAIVIGWDGATSSGVRADAGRLRELVEAACEHGLELAIVSDTHISVIDGQLRARPSGPGSLVIALNRDSELFRIGRDGPELIRRHTVSPAEDTALSRAAQMAAERLSARGLEVRVVSPRPGCRRINLIAMPAWDDPGKSNLAGRSASAELAVATIGVAGLAEVARITRAAAIEAGLVKPRVTSHATHIEMGLTADSRAWIMEWLWRRGIAPDQTLIVNDVVRIGGESDDIAALLSDQMARRRRGELPVIAHDPNWTVAVSPAGHHLERVHEALLTLADGRLGTRGSALSCSSGCEPSVLMAGVYSGYGTESHLLAGPHWNELTSEDRPRGPAHRVLDLHAGVLYERVEDHRGLADAVLFSSLARPGTPVLRARGALSASDRQVPLTCPPRTRCERGEDQGVAWMVVSGQPGSIAAAAESRLRDHGSRSVLDRVAAYEGAAEGSASRERATFRVREAYEAGFDVLLAEHRGAWAARWDDADIRISGDPELQQAIRFALFHMIASVADTGEAAVGARGLSGSAYRGHVFWDSDVYVLPFLAATHPDAARAMLEYRVRRLPAALRAARRHGGRGARFPWESARSGREATPERLHDGHGGWTAVLTGQLEEHIVADIAWAAQCYIDWSGDREFAAGAGRDILVQTARWWASRIELDGFGRGHIRGVMGPDEYHERVDDNAYTNVMARWNLRAAARVANSTVTAAERSHWLVLADAILDGYDARTGIYEQFNGYHGLEPLLVSDVSPHRPIAADMVLGHERTAASQVIKQADVLMLHYLVPDEVAPDSLAANLDFYDPRTAHGSTLSPGVHAALLARAGLLDEAVSALRLTARIDLDDVGDTTAGGLHLAAMGAVWRALTYGFTGLRATNAGLTIDPVLPDSWQSLELSVRYRGSRVRVRVHDDAVTLTADPPLAVSGPGGKRMELTSTPRTARLAPRRERICR